MPAWKAENADLANAVMNAVVNAVVIVGIVATAATVANAVSAATVVTVVAVVAAVIVAAAVLIAAAAQAAVETAAVAHLAHSTPERFLFSSTDFNSYVTVAFADGAPQRNHGRLAASRAPNLGVKPIMKVLGKPVLEVGKAAKR